MSNLEHILFACGISVQIILLFMSVLHLSLLFLKWSFL